MHISDCIGGWCFYDESFNEESKLDEQDMLIKVK